MLRFSPKPAASRASTLAVAEALADPHHNSLSAVFRPRTPKALPKCDRARDHQQPPSRAEFVVRIRTLISSSERKGSARQPGSRRAGNGTLDGTTEGKGGRAAPIERPQPVRAHPPPRFHPNAKRPTLVGTWSRCAPGQTNLERPSPASLRRKCSDYQTFLGTELNARRSSGRF